MVVVKLIEAVTGELQILLIFLFCQGMRISDAIAMTWGVYRDLNPVAIKAGIFFTPHMARRSLGKWNASGAGLRTIMDALDHADPKISVCPPTWKATNRPRKGRFGHDADTAKSGPVISQVEVGI